MRNFLIRAIIVALGLWIAERLVPGFTINDALTLILGALLLGVINAIVRPIVFILTLPITIVTLGLFILVVNGMMVGLVSWLLPGMVVGGFWSSIFVALVVSLTSWVASIIFGSEDRQRPPGGPSQGPGPTMRKVN